MLTIVWDVDDVLNDLMRSWWQWSWLPSHPDIRVRYEDLFENPPHRILGIAESEYLESLDEFRLSARAAEMIPNADVVDWFRANGHMFRHIALTARPTHTIPNIAQWVFRHFGAHIRLFGFVPGRSLKPEPVYDHNKAEFLEWLHLGDVLVDDSETNVREARRLGLQGIVYPRPWNEGRGKKPGDVLQTLHEIRMEPKE
ncbi:MAG: hypothetical protein ABL967_09890 [Bryobacteraceae bacterium]